MLEPLDLTRSSPDPPLLTRRAAAVRANTFDPATGTFEAVLSTGASVQRSDARGPFLEILTVGGVDPATLANVPLLDTHRQSGGADVIGIIVRAWAEAGALVALIRLSSAPDVAGIAHRVREGTLRGVSIGYRVASWREGTDPASGVRTRTAAAWTIHEASLVPVPADPGATVRSQEIVMPDPIVQPTQPPAPVPAVVPPTPAADPAAQTRGQIRAIARSAGLDAAWADAQIDSGADLVAVRSAAFEAMQARSAVVIRTHAPQNDDPAAIITRRMEAVTARVMGTVPTDGARPFMGDRLTDHARAILALRGHSTAGMDQDTLLRAAMHTTSDFPNLLQGVGNRSLLPAYAAAASPLKTLCRRALHTDFRPTSRLRLGEVGPLSKVTEAGEIKYTSRAEAVEGYAIDTYASIFSLSRKAIINDDLGAFRDWSDAAGRAAAETEANLIVGMLTKSNGAGPKMGDGKPLFAAEFGNVSPPNGFADITDLATIALPAARLAMRMQKGLDGKTPINAAPKFLVVSADLETMAEMVLSTIYADSVEQANPIAGRLTLLVEPRLPPSSFYVFADPASLAVLEYAYLSSAQGPQMSSREGWDVLGVEYRVVLDFGCGALDRRGVYRVIGS